MNATSPETTLPSPAADPDSPDLFTLMSIAAELRAGGVTWEQIGQAVGRSPHTCRRWPVLYRREWSRFYNAAAIQRTKEAGEESCKFLRAHMRSKDPKISLAAAHYVEKFNQALIAREDAADSIPSEPPDQELLRQIALVQGMDDAELHDRMQRYSKDFQLSPEGDSVGVRPPPSPAPAE